MPFLHAKQLPEHSQRGGAVPLIKNNPQNALTVMSTVPPGSYAISHLPRRDSSTDSGDVANDFVARDDGAVVTVFLI